MQDVLLVMIVLFLGLVLFTISVWSVTDARRRGKSALGVWILVIFCFPVGMAVWLLLRPDPIQRNFRARV
jgi:hypothetical protein